MCEQPAGNSSYRGGALDFCLGGAESLSAAVSASQFAAAFSAASTRASRNFRIWSALLDFSIIGFLHERQRFAARSIAVFELPSFARWKRTDLFSEGGSNRRCALRSLKSSYIYRANGHAIDIASSKYGGRTGAFQGDVAFQRMGGIGGRANTPLEGVGRVSVGSWQGRWKLRRRGVVHPHERPFNHDVIDVLPVTTNLQITPQRLAHRRHVGV